MWVVSEFGGDEGADWIAEGVFEYCEGDFEGGVLLGAEGDAQ